MKKILKITLIVILVLILGVLAWSYQQFNGYRPQEVDVADIRQEHLKYYKTTYDESRADFIYWAERMRETFENVERMAVPVTLSNGGELAIDLCYIPPSDTTETLLILSSGVHGVEGFVGSALQRMMMDKLIRTRSLHKTGILLIHAMNPYGFYVQRRVTEQNIDLNRNCDLTRQAYFSENNGYAELYKFLNPDSKANPGKLSDRFFYVTAITKIIKSSMPVLRQAVLQGQYQFPEGLYFGGKEAEPQIVTMEPIYREIPAMYNRIVHIDLHTGYGERGKLHLFPNPAKNEEVKRATEDLFSGYPIDWGDGDDFYTITGDFTSVAAHYYPDKLVIPMTFEFGTLDSQTTMGSLVSIHNMILENQGFHHGYTSEKAQRKVEDSFREMYYPSSLAWRSIVMDQTFKMMELVFQRLER